jgi:hypothetical protein
VIHPDPSSSSISHPSGGADTNRYSSNSFFRRLVPVMGNAVDQLANDLLQDIRIFFSIFASEWRCVKPNNLMAQCVPIVLTNQSPEFHSV